MDEFGPLDQEPVAMDEEEAAILLADKGYNVVTNKKSNKVKPKTQPSLAL
jgi:hypothetical protein